MQGKRSRRPALGKRLATIPIFTAQFHAVLACTISFLIGAGERVGFHPPVAFAPTVGRRLTGPRINEACENRHRGGTDLGRGGAGGPAFPPLVRLATSAHHNRRTRSGYEMPLL